MRKLTEAVLVHRDHTSAVISVDFSPTGLEFVTGSYDKTIRIYASASVSCAFKIIIFVKYCQVLV